MINNPLFATPAVIAPFHLAPHSGVSHAHTNTHTHTFRYTDPLQSCLPPGSDDKDAALLSTVQCLPQRYREIMMRSSCPDSQELKISRHPNEIVPGSGAVASAATVTSSQGSAAATPPGGYPAAVCQTAVPSASPHLRLEPLSDKV